MKPPLKLKYIKVHNDIVMFPESVSHIEMANRFQVQNVRSAGFVQIASDGNGGVVATPYGESQTLGISADPDRDAQLLRQVIQ